MKHINSFEFDVLEQPHVLIKMSDGCQLSARIWMPSNALNQPVPAIVEHLPYRKRDGTIVRDELTHPWFAGHGYACIRVDMRGNGDSEGLMADEYTTQELRDACEVIAWASGQSWCSGSVGMMGISWGGFNSLQVAALKPPALKAVITLCSTVDRFADDIHYKGGCLLGENISWAANMLSYSSRPPDPMLVGDQWRKLWLDRLECMPFLASTWLRHQHRDDYWKHGSICEDYAAINAAVLAVGGWHDGYRNTPSHLVSNLQGPVKAIVGPWNHKYPHFGVPGPAIGFLQEAKRWWDHWLKDIDTGVENDPAYRIWLMDSIEPARYLPTRPGRWVGERKWPSENIVPQAWGLFNVGGEGVLVSSTDTEFNVDSNMAINTVPIADSKANTIELSVRSAQSCGLAGGEYFPFASGPELPAEQSPDDEQSLRFNSKLLTSPIDIIGAPVIEMEVSVDSAQALICARLCEIHPDGTSALITMGLLNLAHRTSSEQPELLTPGQCITTTLSLDQIAFRVPAGHRLRLSLSTSYWPFVWPSPANTVVSVRSGSLSVPCKRCVKPIDEPVVSFKAPEAAPAWQAETLRTASSTRDTYSDPDSGLLTTTIINDFGEFRDSDHGLVAGSATRELWSIHPDDPLSARVQIHWEQTGGRGDWQWTTNVEMQMRADQHHFHVMGKLMAFENGELIFERNYKDTIERKFV